MREMAVTRVSIALAKSPEKNKVIAGEYMYTGAIDHGFWGFFCESVFLFNSINIKPWQVIIIIYKYVVATTEIVDLLDFEGLLDLPKYLLKLNILIGKQTVW